MLRLNISAGEDVDAASAAAGRSRPELRRTQLAPREPVKQFSCLDRDIREGSVVGFGAVRLRMPDGARYVFPQVFEVQGDGAPFCREGDSGSLVSDGDHRVVGIVLGASEPGNDPRGRRTCCRSGCSTANSAARSIGSSTDARDA